MIYDHSITFCDERYRQNTCRSQGGDDRSLSPITVGRTWNAVVTSAPISGISWGYSGRIIMRV